MFGRKKNIPVYLINGFLEGGKTTFIAYTLEQEYFQIKGKTLLLLCEEGEEEYDEDLLEASNTVVEVIEKESDFTPGVLEMYAEVHNPSRIIIEYNGMCLMRDKTLPSGWVVEQQITHVDGSTFDVYYKNMKSLFGEMVKSSDMVIFNRCDEVEDLAPLKRTVKAVNQTCEIIFVDGGSQDKTCELISDDFKLVHSPKGRGNQMNAGAKESKGDVLFFLHADSILPEGFEKEIKEVITRYSAGCFGITFDSDSCLMKICSFMSNVRAGIFHVMFGDQGIFMDRESFFSVGGFPSLPLMEDYQFSLNLKKAGIKSGMTRKRIRTSARRFPDSSFGKLRTMWKMQMLRRKYRKGADMEDILSEYRDIR